MEKKRSVITQLFDYAGNHRYFTICSWILAAISALVALMPFYYIWCIIREVVEVRPDFSKATHIVSYGWNAVGMSLLANVHLHCGTDVFSCGGLPGSGEHEKSHDGACYEASYGVH